MLERWLRIELRHLFALEAVAEEGSFSAAGDRLGYVQSAVSHQIAALETVVGKRLFERTRGTKPVALTSEGRLLYDHAKMILARVRAAEADLSSEAGTRPLLVGSFQTISSRIMPRVLQLLDDDLQIELVEYTTEVGLLERLAAGGLDAVFTEGPLSDGPFESVNLFDDPYVILAAASSEIGDAGLPLSLREIAELPLVGHSGERPRFHRHLEARNLRPKYVVRSDVNTTIQSLVAGGLAYAVVPRFSVDLRHDDVVALPLDPPDAIEPRVVAVAWNSDRALEPRIAAFVRTVQEVCAQLGLMTLV